MARRFVEFWKPKPTSPLRMVAHVGVYYRSDGETGNVLADSPDWRTFEKGIGKDHLLPMNECETLDAELAARLIAEFCPNGGGKLFPTVTALADALDELDHLDRATVDDDLWSSE